MRTTGPAMRMHRSPPSASAGFTLTEMFVVVLIAGILAGVALPNMKQFILDNARSTRINSLVTALNLARSEAVKRNGFVSVCGSANLGTCNAPAGRFETGWIVFLDTDGNGAKAPDPAEPVLRVFQPDMAGSATLRGRIGPAGAAVSSLTYQGNGRPRSMLANTGFIYCDERGAKRYGRAVLITTTGQPRISRDADGDGLHEVGGGNLQC